jgi:hypothetical protein
MLKLNFKLIKHIISIETIIRLGIFEIVNQPLEVQELE